MKVYSLLKLLPDYVMNPPATFPVAIFPIFNFINLFKKFSIENYYFSCPEQHADTTKTHYALRVNGITTFALRVTH